jgi:ABC-type multidrug transport system permease subunit
MAVIAYWLIGLSNTANQFFILVLDCVVVAFTGSSMGLLVGSVVDDYKSASVVMTFLLVPSSYFSGLYKNLGNLPVWIGWVQYISSMRYGWAAMVQNEVQYSSAPYLDSMNFSTGMWANIFLSLLLGILFRVLSLYLLWRFRVKN